ncbi:calcium binding EGF domain protein [Ancylostoma caninum]|uniref:Calcium binding EGF domain protein n=1 Tax=Ancylostoma caninum TaxID=29170 RepID=A0A368G3Y5_ANCCA|nr:calcium binding EGF domain protein [Ancylostoma caninum]
MHNTTTGNFQTKRCEDIDECEKFAGHVCDLSAECQNTVGSFICKCKEGFELAADGRRCEDINECERGTARCEQKCINIPGSYQCICDRGYTVGSDGRTCEDIDECALWAGSGSDLCMGGCVNTKGSYLCQCPPGYKIQPDGRTCVDVDECALGECQGHERICVNTLGQFKCHRIECPPNYVHDNNYKKYVSSSLFLSMRYLMIVPAGASRWIFTFRFTYTPVHAQMIRWGPPKIQCLLAPKLN